MDLSDDEVLCTAPVAAVEEAFGPVTDARIGGSGLSVGDVDIQSESCTFELEDGTEVRVSVTDDGLWDDWVEAMRSSDFTRSYAASSIGKYATFDNGQELLVDDSEQPLRITASGLTLSVEDSGATRVALAEMVLAG